MNPLAWFLILLGVVVAVVGFRGDQDKLLSAVLGKDVAIGHPLYLGKQLPGAQAPSATQTQAPQGTVNA